jgi:hypothetical protein
MFGTLQFTAKNFVFRMNFKNTWQKTTKSTLLFSCDSSLIHKSIALISLYFELILKTPYTSKLKRACFYMAEHMIVTFLQEPVYSWEYSSIFFNFY